MKVLFYLFGFPIHFFGLMISIGILAGVFIAHMEIKRKKLDINVGLDIVLYSIIAAVIGARLFYILFYDLSYYINNPAEIILINEGGLSIHGGLVSAFITAYIYMRKNRQDLLKYADAMAPGIILGQAIGRVGCDVFGRVMNVPLPWGIYNQGYLVHPTQVYEFLLDYLVFFILWNKRKNARYEGQIFVWYLIMFSFNRSIVELFRINPTIFGGISISFVLSATLILIAMVLMMYAKKKKSETRSLNSGEAIDRSNDLINNIILTTALASVSLVIFYSVQA
jgi:phosphatidylglycerol:prolipoprotein diacylglycerol transferase